MKILFIGDIYARSGRDALERHLPQIRAEHEPDAIIINADNATHGMGINREHCEEFLSWGIDCITTGDHVWNQRDLIPYIDRAPRVIRALNFPMDTPGKGVWQGTLKNGQKLTVIHLIGRVFMEPLDCPFQAVEKFLNQHNLHRDGPVFIDFHAEATSEKGAMVHFVDGRVAAVIGTHTHIPTADEHIMPRGTAYQTDTGMTGDYNSVIGADKNIPVHHFLRRFSTQKRQPATGRGTLCGALVTVDPQTGLAVAIERVKYA